MNPVFDQLAMEKMNNKHLNTLTRKDRYSFNSRNGVMIDTNQTSHEDILYSIDGRDASAIVISKDDERKLSSDNAAAFLDQEMSDEEFLLGCHIQGDEEDLGYTAVYGCPDQSFEVERAQI